MNRVMLYHPGFESSNCELRPTHVRLVFEEITKDTAFGSELGFAVRAADFGQACETVRNRYRCRDVRKELARAKRLADEIEDKMAHTPWLRLSCSDRGLMAELLHLQNMAKAA